MSNSSQAERRLQIAAALDSNPDTSQAELAKQFGVSIRTIQADVAAIPDAPTSQPAAPDLGSTLAELKASFEDQITSLEKSREAAKPGSRAYMDHTKALFQMRADHLKILQQTNAIQKNMDAVADIIYEFRCVVLKDGEISSSGGRRQMTPQEIAERDKLAADLAERQRLFGNASDD